MGARMHTRLSKVALLALASLFSLVLMFYVFVYDLLHAKSGGSLALSDDQCTDPAQQGVKKENPNKLLFISCGGFLE